MLALQAYKKIIVLSPVETVLRFPMPFGGGYLLRRLRIVSSPEEKSKIFLLPPLGGQPSLNVVLALYPL